MEWRESIRAPRRRHRRDKFLTKEQRVAEVVKIVGEDRRNNVEGVVSCFIEIENEAAAKRTRESKLHSKRVAKQFDAALRRMTAVVNQLPLRDELLPQLNVLNGVSAALTHMAVMEPVLPKPNADAKVFAAHAALIVCRECGIKPTTTAGSNFLRIAAALYGDLQADLDHHCRKVRHAWRTAEPRQK